jgi:hypothetical protein
MRFQLRFRSTQHDAESDRARLTRIHQTVRSAVKDAERELNGLRARLEEARQSAALLLANMESGDRDQSHDFKLKSVEERLLAAEKRIRELGGPSKDRKCDRPGIEFRKLRGALKGANRPIKPSRRGTEIASPVASGNLS